MTRAKYNKAIATVQGLAQGPSGRDSRTALVLALDDIESYICSLERELDDAKENLAIAEDTAQAYRTGAYLTTAIDDPWIRASVAQEIDFREPKSMLEAWEAGMRGLIGTEVEAVFQ